MKNKVEDETRVRRQGQCLQARDVERILKLLETELTITEICQRMNVTRSTVANLNRKAGIRSYSGRRNYWTVAKGGDN